MSEIFANIPNDVQDDPDRVPAKDGAYDPLKTGLYRVVIKKCYLETSVNGADMARLELERLDEPGPTIRENLVLSTTSEKDKRNFYYDRNGVKHWLRGFNLLKQMHTIITGKPINEAVVETKVLKLRNFESNQDESMEREVLVELVDQPLIAGILLATKNQVKYVGNGQFEDTPTEKIFNTVNKVFHPEGGFTVGELKAKAKEAKYATDWKERFPEDYVQKRFKPLPTSDDSIDMNDGSDKDDLPWKEGEASKPEAVENIFD